MEKSMFEHRKIQELDDFFKGLDCRKEKGVYFYRINGYNEEVARFIRKYYEAARLKGVILEGKIPNPDEGNLSYYQEIMGTGFQMSMGFFLTSLKNGCPECGTHSGDRWRPPSMTRWILYGEPERMRIC